MLGAVTSTLSRPTLVRAEGVHVWDAAGRSYLDAVSGAFCVQLGYSRPDLVAAMAEAAGRLPFARRAAFDNPQALAYERELLEAAGAPFTRVHLTSSGSEAVDAALKLAYRYQCAVGSPSRRTFAFRPGHYHGATLGALSVTGYRARRAPYEGLFESQVPVPSTELDGAAALILETVPAAGLGALVPAPGDLARVRSECDAAGALWIADEVLTGFGRVGSLFAWQRLGERTEDRGATPDLVVFGKGAGAGFAALGGLLVSDRVARALDAAPFAARFAHQQTYGGQPAPCAVGRRVLAALREERIYDRVRALESPFGEALRSLGSDPRVLAVRGMGFLWAIDLGAFPTEGLSAACRERGVLVYAGAGGLRGADAGFLLLAPPLIADRGTLEQIAAGVRAALAKT